MVNHWANKMKAYFPYLKALVFDIDYTLYRHHEYYSNQGPLLVERYAKESNQSLEYTLEQFSGLRKQLGENGKDASYTLTLETLGISVEKQSLWKNKLFKPENYLQCDEKLVETLRSLGGLYKIFAFTNNTTFLANKTLEILGVKSLFTDVWGSDKIGKPKPTAIPYEMISKDFDVPLHSIVAIGDRYNVDLHAPIVNGCAGVLVESMEDIYNLIDLFSAPEPA